MKKILFFHTRWCPSCRNAMKTKILPLIDLFGKEKIEIIDADVNPQFAEKCGVTKLPAFFYIYPEQHIYMRVDHYSFQQLKELLDDKS